MEDKDAEELLARLQNADSSDREGLLRLIKQLGSETQAATDWCEAAGQSEPLTTRLKNLLKDYPADVGLFKEMVQNADDAGATKVHFVWDQRRQGMQHLLAPEMKRWQGSCLWAYNDAIFTEQDFEAICRLGVGGKRRETQRIGRFGLGFNSVYNLTDVPSILSDDVILFLDPHVTNLQAMGASTQKPGIKLKFKKINVLQKFKDQFAPYHGLFGCDLAANNSDFKGTLIRIPFRTAETAQASEISKIVVDDAMMQTLLQQFQSEAFQWLLFLQNVREITMSRTVANNDDGTPILEELGTVSLARLDASSARPSIVTCKAGEKWGSAASGSSSSNVTATLDIRCELSKLTSATAPKADAIIRRYHLFTDTRHKFSSRVCLAVPLAQDRDAVADLARLEEDGRVFCFLPVPRNVDLGLRVHVHAPLNMAQDRRSVLLDDRVGASEREMVRHNFQLLDDLAPTALLACLTDLAVRRNQTPPARFFGLFPSMVGRSGTTTPAERLASVFYNRLVFGGKSAEDPRLPLPVASFGSLENGAARSTSERFEASPSHWVPFADAVFVPSLDASRSSEPAKGSRTNTSPTTERLLNQVVDQLLRAGVPLVDAPGTVLESIERVLRPKHATVLTPRWLREFLRKAAAGQNSLPLKGTSNAHGIFGEMTPEEVAVLLEFALSDGDVADLAGVPLLLCEDEEAVQVFSDAKVPSAFVPENENERRLFPRSRDGRRCCLALRLEKRPVVWAQLRQMAQAQRDQKGVDGRPSFQCRLLDFPLLIEALQRLLPRTWNEVVPKVSLFDWNDWVEVWLQSLWRWLELKGIPMTKMAYWPIIPSWNGKGDPKLHRVPDQKKPLASIDSSLFFSVAKLAAPPSPPEALGEDGTASSGEVAQASTASKLDQSSCSREMASLLERRLNGIPVHEPDWLLKNHERELRNLVHAGTPEGFLRTMHVASRMGITPLASGQRSSNAGSNSKPDAPKKLNLRAALSDGLTVEENRALVVISALAQRGGSSYESSQGTDWKIEVVRNLPLFCRFNKPTMSVAVSDAKQANNAKDTASWSLLPETCQEVVAALRASGVELPGCVEVPQGVLQKLSVDEANVVASLLRDLALPRLRWSDTLLDHVFPWALKCEDMPACQGLMLAIVCRWREMELSGNDRCIDALQDVRFVSTIGGEVLCPRQVLDPAVEELRLLYCSSSNGSRNSTGPFPDRRFLSVECRQVLRYRRELNFQELTERIMHLHEFEVQRRADATMGSSNNSTTSPKGSGDGGTASTDTSLQEVVLNAEALVRYAIEHVLPSVAKLGEAKPKPPPPPPQPRQPAKPEKKKPEANSNNFWQGFADMFTSTIESASQVMPSVMTSSTDESSKSNRPSAALSEDELVALRAKLQGCAWLPAALPPHGWPASAPWYGRKCGLCFAAEVRLASEDALVGMVRPLVGPRASSAKGTSSMGSDEADGASLDMSVRVPLPKAFMDVLQLEDQPPEAMIREQLLCMQRWVETLPESDRDTHKDWITRCLYDRLYPVVLPTRLLDAESSEKENSSIEELVKKLPRVWVPHGGFVLPSRISKQTIDFPPYLVRAPIEWREKLPWLWAKIKAVFTVNDCADALQCIQEAQKSLSVGVLDVNRLDMAVRMVMAITDMVKEQRELGNVLLGSGSDIKILMPIHDGSLRPVEECVFNNMTWLPDVETSEVDLANFYLVHPKISHDVAHTCGCRGLSIVYAREATEMAGADWFEAAGQSEPMTTRLKNLLKDYPADISIFKEMTQNADDAGATKVHFVWDWRQFRKQSLLTPDMERWQGPALWVFNDATFSERDFESICRLGVGGKREVSQKIGRFGLGFNSTYNLTDVPSILSNDVVLFLDPHVRHLQAMGASAQKPGIKMRFMKINVLEKFRDQFEPYHGLLGCDLKSSDPFSGTLIRVPFRTAEAGKSSEISNIVVDHAIAEALCGQFQAEAHQWLLFLQNVVDIEVSEIGEDQTSGAPNLRSIARVRLRPDERLQDLSAFLGTSDHKDAADDADAEKSPVAPVEKAAAISKMPRPRMAVAGPDGPASLANLSIEASLSSGVSAVHGYCLVSGFAKTMEEQVCIAVPLQQKPDTQSEGMPTLALGGEEGRIFCFLPLPRSAVSLRLPVHVHAPLNTAQDRRSVLLDDRIGARELIQHNLRLLDQRIPECLFRCICELSDQTSVADLFRIFPTLSSGGGREVASSDAGVSERVAHAFYKLLISPKRPERILPVVSASIAEHALPDWRVAFKEAVFFPKQEHGSGAENYALLREVSVLLARFGVPVVEVPSRLLESLERVLHPAQPRMLTPMWLRQLLRAISTPSDGKSRQPSFKLVKEQPDNAAEQEEKIRKKHVPGNTVNITHLTPADAFVLLEFVLADNDTADLEGVPLLVTESLDSGTQPFRSDAGTTHIFVPEDDDEYAVLPQAPSRLINRDLKKLRPKVWQCLRYIASDKVNPDRSETDSPPPYQLRKVTFEPVVQALQTLLPQSWNVPIPEIGLPEWEGWVENWLKAMWKWMARLSLPMSKLHQWPLIPSISTSVENDGGNDANPRIQKVHLYKLLPSSVFFSASPNARAVDNGSEATESLLQSDLWEVGAGNTSSIKKAIAGILESRLSCPAICEPEWLKQHFQDALRAFVHAGTAEGMMKAVHNRLKQIIAKLSNGKKDGDHRRAALQHIRQAFEKDLSSEDLRALAVWISFAQRSGCSCPSSSSLGWKSMCDIVRSVPLFCPFSQPSKRVSLSDFVPANGASESSANCWRMLPSSCPEVVAALRAAGVDLGSVVEIPSSLESGGGTPTVVVDAVSSLVKELSLPKLSWSEIMIRYAFPWASSAQDSAARQGLMMAVIRQWREMELPNNEQCVETLQQVPFVKTVGGDVLSPCQLLDSSADELRRLYGPDGSDGPFPSPELYTLLSSAAQKGLLKFRRELTIDELVERFTYLHKNANNTDNMDAVVGIAESLLQYVADHVVERLEISGERAKRVTSDKESPDENASKSSSASFFLWPASMRSVVGGSSASEPLLEIAEDELEVLKAKARSCTWIPAAKAPREWLTRVPFPWAGSEQKLCRAEMVRLMPEFMTCGAAMPLICLETQLGIASDRKVKIQKFLLELLGIPERMDNAERRRVAWKQLEVVQDWWVGMSQEDKSGAGVSTWVTNCLHSHVYPHLEPRPAPPPPPRQDGNENKPVEAARSRESTVLSDLFIDSHFVELDDISVEQNFPHSGLHQLPGSLRGIPTIRSLVKPRFSIRDCSRALEHIKTRLAAEKRPQMNVAEIDTTVSLAMTIAERVRTTDESLPESVLVTTNRGTLREAHDCVFNNMKWLSPEEQQKRSAKVTGSGLDWVHASISNDVAQALQVRGLNALVAAEAMGSAGDDDDEAASWFEAAGQTEPLTTRLKYLLQDTTDGSSASYLSIIKELLQNADDAQATEVNFVWDWRRHGTQSLMSPEMAKWQGPCLWAHNDASFSPQDFENITQLGAMGKTAGRGRKQGVSQIGRFGLGFNSVYHFTDLPSILSDDRVLFLDPHVRHLRGMGATAQKPGIKLRILKVDLLDKFRDQFEPYHGLFGCDLTSSSPYPGTLIRVPFRTAEVARTSEINNYAMTQARALETLMAFRHAAEQCIIFLQNVKKITFSWIPPEAGAKAILESVLEVCIEPPCSSAPPSEIADDVSEPPSTLVTDEEALECRKLFASRTLPQSRERRSFITSLLGRIGLGTKNEMIEEAPPHAAFNLAVSLRWKSQSPGGFEWPTRNPEGHHIDVWRLFLRHDDAESLGWNIAPAATGTESAPDQNTAAPAPADTSNGDFVPFAGIALCLTRPLRPEEPRISCFLPLPVQSSLPFLLNANFMLSDPTSISRLDLAMDAQTGNAGKGAAWNRLLLDKLVGPMIHACIQEQARHLQALPRSESNTHLPCARWAASQRGICALMPTKGHLPKSFQQLLNLSELYKGLGDVVLFPPLELAPDTAQTNSTQQNAQGAPLLSFTGSVQPLIGDSSSAGQRQAVHEYMRDAGSFHLCYVVEEVANEFTAAGIKRHAELTHKLVVESLHSGRRPKNSKMAADLLAFLLTGDLGKNPADALKGLPLAPLCDGSVAKLCDENKPLCCAFPGGQQSEEIAASARFVLENLCASHTIDLVQVGQSGTALLRRCAEPLCITDVNSSEHLAQALKDSGSNICARANQNSSATMSKMAAAATAFVGNILGSGANYSESASANALGLGNAQQATAIICSLWDFALKTAEGLDDSFLENFTDFFIVPASDVKQSYSTTAPQAANGTSASSESPPDVPAPPVATPVRTLELLPLSAERPLLLPPGTGASAQQAQLFGIASSVLADRFVDIAHPAMTPQVVNFLVNRSTAKQFSGAAVLDVIAASTGKPADVSKASFKAIASRCSKLSSSHRDQLCIELSASFCALSGSMSGGGDATERSTSLQSELAAMCGLSIFLGEACLGARSGSQQAVQTANYRALTDLCVVDGEPLQLSAPPSRLDLRSDFVFRRSQHVPQEVAEVLGLAEVQEYLKARRCFMSPDEWLLAHVVPHMADLVPDDQVAVLERLLPDLSLEQANHHSGLVPAEVVNGVTLLKVPCELLDGQDFLIQEVFGLGGSGAPVPLPRSSSLHFPAKYMPTSVRQHLRRLGMRQSANDGACLIFLSQELSSSHAKLEAEKYGELQRSLLQKLVESWNHLNGQAQQALLSEQFVSVASEVDGGELPESLFALRPFRDSCSGGLIALKHLVCRLDSVDPFLCWTSLPLSPRGFPEFIGYRKPTLDDVVRHTKVLGELADSGAVSYHLWPEFRERVVAPLCSFLANHEPFSTKLALTASVDASDDTANENEASTNRDLEDADKQKLEGICRQLRRTKFLAVPLDGSDAGPHALVAPWRISLALREHRPPMFALPEYLQEHIPLLRLIGVREAHEVPQSGGGAMGGDKDAMLAMETANRWLFEHGAESFSDVTVHCDGGKLYLHRNILMARSDYFRAMFQGGDYGFREGQEGGAEVHLLEATVDVAQVIFGYLYHGRVDEAPLEGAEGASNAVDLLQLSDQLGVPQLFEFAQLWIANQQDLEDCPTTLELATRHRAEMLEQATLSLMAANFDEPEVKQQLANLTPEHREAIDNMRPRR